MIVYRPHAMSVYEPTTGHDQIPLESVLELSAVNYL